MRRLTVSQGGISWLPGLAGLSAFCRAVCVAQPPGLPVAGANRAPVASTATDWPAWGRRGSPGSPRRRWHRRRDGTELFAVGRHWSGWCHHGLRPTRQPGRRSHRCWSREPGRGRRTHLERHRIFRWCRGWHCAERRSRHRTRRPRYRHRTGQLRAGLGGQVGCAAQRRCAVWGTHQHLRARPGGRSGIIGAWCHPDRHLEGHRRGFRGRRRIFGQLRVQRRRGNPSAGLGVPTTTQLPSGS
ncbi:Uncharacterised protein [Mycobacterium tuberculosis]|nr:Uncharacterised protein [Mycobacterium tuberculosis]